MLTTPYSHAQVTIEVSTEYRSDLCKNYSKISKNEPKKEESLMIVITSLRLTFSFIVHLIIGDCGLKF